MEEIIFEIYDLVRHIDEETNKHYGLMEIREIKGDEAVCGYGDEFYVSDVTFPLKELEKVKSYNSI